MEPVFTIILVTYKRFGYLKEAIQSVQNQIFSEYECFIFNDWPIDNALIEEWIYSLNDPRFQFYPSDQSRGANYWRNFGVKNAKGQYIAFLDDDDQWFSKKLEEHYSAHINENAFIVYSDYIRIWPDQSRESFQEDNAHYVDDVKKSISTGRFSISTTSSVTLKNELTHPLFDESLQSFQDWDAWFNIALSNSDAKFHRIAKPLLYFIQHSNERISKNYRKRFAALGLIKRKYSEKGIDITGFYYKEKLNIYLLFAEGKKFSKYQAITYIVKKMLKEPAFFRFLYTYKRIARFILKNK